MKTEVAERFETMRASLIRHAYRMLGDHGEAEDVVQDAYLRWSDARENQHIDDDGAFLRTVVTRLCLDRLRSARSQREVYVGPWLPEPVLSDERDQPEEAALLADDISFALMLALERLAPLERAAFLLHDALSVPFEEVAQTLGRSVHAVRKLASRAREHVRDANRHSSTPRDEAVRLRDALLRALNANDAQALQRLLTDDVVFVSDGGGKVPSAMVPVSGSKNVSALLMGLQKKGAARIHRIDLVTLNGLPGYAFFSNEGLDTVMALQTHGGQIAAMYVVRNPDKLRGIATALP